MPKRASIFLAVFALALSVAACGGGGSNPVPSPSPIASITPDPKNHTANVAVTILGSPAPKIVVQISTPKSSSSPRPGTPFDTQTSNKKGTAVFKGLNPSKTYCWVALLSASQTSSTCAPFYIWQTGPVNVGT